MPLPTPVRAFVALPLPKDIKAALAELLPALHRAAPAKLAFVRPETWHVTLKFLGDVPLDGPMGVSALIPALAEVDFAPFDLSPGGGVFFPNPARPRVVAVGLSAGADACRELAGNVETALADLGFPRETRAFTPHLTVARRKDAPARGDSLSPDRMLPVVRWLDIDTPAPALTVEPPLRLLIAVAAPSDRPGLDVGEEIAHLDTALAELTARGVMHTVRLDHATLERLDNALLEHRPHVLHFIGHGDFAGDEGVLVLESDTTPGAADPIAGRQLAVLLRNHLTSLRLIFLNSCMGATAAARDPVGGMAQSLIRRGSPAVIAMQFPIPDGAAVALARHFYRYNAAGQPVDAALTSTRAFLYARGYAVEWGAPALHMRTPDGRLFDLTAPPQIGRAHV